MDLIKLRAMLASEESIRFKPYTDSVGKLTIGIGHNLTDNGISQAICDAMFQEDIYEVMDDLDKELPWWQNLDDVRARVFADLCFNMGITTLCTFTKMINASVSQDWSVAAIELRNSKWFTDVGPIRGNKLVNMLLTGQDA